MEKRPTLYFTLNEKQLVAHSFNIWKSKFFSELGGSILHYTPDIDRPERGGKKGWVCNIL